MRRYISSGLRFTLLLCLTMQLTGCVYWRLYQTKVQMEEFNHNFAILVDEDFTLTFKQPLIFSDDVLYLTKLQPTQKKQQNTEQSWKYVFRKVDDQNRVLQPEIKFHWGMTFDQNQLMTSWSLSSLFLQIAPAEFLERSIRSLASAEIFTVSKQVKADLDVVEKVSAVLPKRLDIERHLGEPLSTEQRKDKLVYRYRFLLDSPDIETGYEERAISIIKLYFDNESDDLIKMSGRFAGLKIAIDYRKLIANSGQKS